MVDLKVQSENLKKVYFDTGINFNEYFKTIAIPVDDSAQMQELFIALITGNVLALYNNELWDITGASKKENRGVGEVEREPSFEGGLESFIEEVEININLVMQYYHQPNVIVKNFSVGTSAYTRLSIMYDKELVDKQLLNTITNEINNIDVKLIQSLTQLQKNLFKKQLLIPRLLVTQRPDRTILALSRGKIIIFLDGTPMALILPATFHDFMSTVDDRYLLPIPAAFLISLRYIALVLSLLLPAAYISITSFNPEILRLQLAVSIAASRSGIPYPSFVEVLLMLIMMEFLVEASLRLPKTIGQTATTVGGLILGQAATQAHLVSDIMIIIVATVAISNFIIPVTSMNLSIRVLKYFVFILSCFAGIFGIFLALLCILCYMFSIYSFNTSFMDPIGNFTFKGFASFFKKGQKT